MKNDLLNDLNIPSLIKDNFKLRPFVHFSCSSSDTVSAFLLFLIPQIVMLWLSGTVSSLYVILSSVIGSLSAESINSVLSKKKIFVVLSLVQGIIIGLLLPSGYPVISVFFLTLFSLLIFKYAFGGFSHPWINPAAVTVALAWLFNISAFPSFLVTGENLFSHNPSLILIQNGQIPVLPFDTKITLFLNEKIFNVFGLSIPEGYISLLWDSNSVIPAFRFNLITLITSAVFFAFDFVSGIIPACHIVVYGLLVYFVSSVAYGGMPGSGDVILALMSSGTLFTSIFLLSWFGTAPVSHTGKIFYGISAGIIAFFIVGCGTSPAGSVFTVILTNIVSLFYQQAEDFLAKRKMALLSEKEIIVFTGNGRFRKTILRKDLNDGSDKT
ncbi:RnfABCDGE type electron transport complex subunit D [Treponema parvum]|uniref:RnfABCDGE type electron transport complex subunit D n=1 Tax=Treponema parvum TaxID=138851 RepID=UPI001AEC0CCA|nr:RnfABCDGE type electron transport complex subunit D [Treponema parvum]QTQ16229.1 RnfABCDGE type electron transport complex subunit D [Treponema parvum]